MRKFEVGETIALLIQCGTVAEVGATAIVLGYKNGYINIKWVRNGLDNEQEDGGYLEEEFKSLCKKPKKQYGIVKFMESIVK